MRPLSIAFVFSAQNSVFPPEGIVDAPNLIGGELAQGLISKGHKVTIYASKLHNLNPYGWKSGKLNSLFEDFKPAEWAKFDNWTKVYSITTYDAELLQIMQEDVLNKNYDIIHFQNPSFYTVLPFITKLKQPKIFTLHNPIYPVHRQIFENFNQKYETFGNCFFVPISKLQLQDLNLPDKSFEIQHGINLSKIRFNETPRDFMVFVGRITPAKGVHVAIQIAKTTKKIIHISGRKSTEHLDYFEKELVPSFDNKTVIFHENSTRDVGIKLFSDAKLFIFPLQWEEPFGLVLVEAMATGTPVVTFARGSIPEVVKDGVTGFIINPSDTDIRGGWIIKKTGVEGLCEAVQRIYDMPPDQYRQMRLNCRKHVEENFTVERMVDEYEKVYQQILAINH